MAEFQQRNNSGILFKNNRKKQDNHPDYQGDATIGGKKYKMSAWLKQGARGKFTSFSFTAKDSNESLPSRETQSQPEPQSEPQQEPAGPEENIPF
jgi:hypothetical protein